MDIKSVEVFRYTLPFVEALPVAQRTLAVRTGLLLRVTGNDGAVGLGEAAPLPGYSPDTIEEAAQQAASLTELAGKPVPEGVERLDGGFDAWIGARVASPALRFGFELAVMNLLAAGKGVPLRRLVAPDARDTVPVLGLLNGNLGEIRHKAAALQREGYRAVKLKVGRYSLADDVQTTLWLCNHLRGISALRLDVNRAWDFDTAVEYARETVECTIEYLEEPLREPGRLTEFAETTGSKLALDETLRAVDPEEVPAWPNVTTLVLKPTVLGLEKTVRLARKGRSLGLRSVISSSFESGLGLFALAQVAAAVQGDGEPAGLDTYEWLGGDVFQDRLPLRRAVLDLDEVQSLIPPLATERLQKLNHG